MSLTGSILAAGDPARIPDDCGARFEVAGNDCVGSYGAIVPECGPTKNHRARAYPHSLAYGDRLIDMSRPSALTVHAVRVTRLRHDHGAWPEVGVRTDGDRARAVEYAVRSDDHVIAEFDTAFVIRPLSTPTME